MLEGFSALYSSAREFVPVAVDEAGGFANFREKATKTNSVVDRLENLTLPKLDDVEQGLEKFIENKEEAEELEREIQDTDEQIDASRGTGFRKLEICQWLKPKLKDLKKILNAQEKD